jgi:hypothetical protein
MELLDRYLKAVAKGLPDAQREDILRELSEDLRSEMEDKQAELGHPLTPAEQEAILRQHGNPLLLAARFRQDHRSVSFGRQLIGPVLYPFYAKVLSFNLGLTSAVIAIIFTALAVSGQKLSFARLLSTVLLQLFIQFAIVTFIFSMVQRNLTRFPDRWNLDGVSGIPLDFKFEENIREKLAKEDRDVPRFESISMIVALAVSLVWLREVQSHPFLIFGPAALFLKLAPIWTQLYRLIVLLAALGILQATVNLFRPRWTRFRSVAQVVLQVGSLVLLCFLLRAGTWAALSDNVSASDASGFSRAVEYVNRGIFYGLLIAALITAVQIVLKIAHLLRAPRNPASLPGVNVIC